MELEGKVAVVTGAGAGLGRLLAVALASAGAQVFAADVDEEAARDTCDQITSAPPSAAPSSAAPSSGALCWAVRCDVTDPGDRERLIALATAAGGPHILVNNAGGWTAGDQYPAAAAADWQRTMELNLIGPMQLTQLALSARAGVVLNIASSAGLGADPYGSPEYGASKAGLIRFTTTMGDHPLTRVMCIVPGWIGLERAHAEVAALPPAERPTLIPPDDVVDSALRLLRSGEAGTIVEML
ncbi:SDR family NAD(P)-dependent oxidoreductase [Actinoplanes sp. CA-131856]